MTQAIIRSLEERLLRLRGRRTVCDLVSERRTIGERCSSMPDLDTRPIEEILDYDTDEAPS